MGQLQSLAFAKEKHRVVAGDVASPDSVHAQLIFGARADNALSAVNAVFRIA